MLTDNEIIAEILAEEKERDLLRLKQIEDNKNIVDIPNKRKKYIKPERRKSFFVIDRKIWRNETLKQNPELYTFFQWLLSKAFFEDTNYKGELFKRGEGLTGVGECLREFKWMTNRKYRSLFQTMRNSEYLTTRTTNKGTVFFILNYDKYQDAPVLERQADHASKPNKNVNQLSIGHFATSKKTSKSACGYMQPKQENDTNILYHDKQTDNQNDKQKTTINNYNNYKYRNFEIFENKKGEISKDVLKFFESENRTEVILINWYLFLDRDLGDFFDVSNNLKADSLAFYKQLENLKKYKNDHIIEQMANISVNGEFSLDDVLDMLK